MLKVIELFAGIGSQTQALKNIGVGHEVIGISEIDNYAIKSYEAIHGKVNNFGDITKITKLPYCDLLTYSFPCTDISLAGKQEGIKIGTRSGLLLEVERLLENMEENPKYLLLENVKNLVGKKFKVDFDKWLNKLEELGYKNYWKVLNAKNYGIPQNRERVFIVSIRKDLEQEYEFPKEFDNKLRLKDMLDNNVEEKYYLSESIQKNFLSSMKYKNDDKLSHNQPSQILQVGMPNIKGNEQIRRVYDKDGLSPTLNTMQGGNRQPKVMIKEATKKGYAVAEIGDSINIEQPNSKTRRGRVGKEIAQTLNTSPQQVTLLSDYRIRKLTPKECWRLMGFKDEQFNKAKESAISDSQLYKQAGNSIVVNVLEEIFKNLFK